MALAPVRHFHSVDEVLVALRAEVPDNPFRTDPDLNDFEWVAVGHRAQLVPSLASEFWSPFLYRGQRLRPRHCVPGVFRDIKFVNHPQKLSRLERASCFVARVRLEEFLCALQAHPATAFAREIDLVTYPEAIAQHYEMQTDRLDFTQDPAVAAFFATNEPLAHGQWRPKARANANPEPGVIYRLNFPYFLRHLRSNGPALEWIGRQALPRPGEQRAWTFRLPLGRDLESFPIDVFTFEHDLSAAHRLNERFEGGRTLFPPDVLSEISAKINASASIPRDLVSKVLKLYGCDGELHDRELQASGTFFSEEFGISVTDRRPIGLSPLQLRIAQSAAEELTESFVGYVRAVRCATGTG